MLLDDILTKYHMQQLLQLDMHEQQEQVHLTNNNSKNKCSNLLRIDWIDCERANLNDCFFVCLLHIAGPCPLTLQYCVGFNDSVVTMDNNVFNNVDVCVC
jgi:hypothetical protein